MTELLIIGSGGHAKVVIAAIEYSDNFSIVGLLDDFEKIGSHKYGYPIAGKVDHASGWGGGLFIAVGDVDARMNIVKGVGHPPERYHTIIHATASVTNDEIGRGSFVAALAHVGPDCKIGNFSIVNTKASLDHDSTLGHFSHLAPGATTGGNVRIGDSTFIGINASIRDHVTIGDNCVIGAGSVVLKDVPHGTTGWGNPFKAQ